MSRTASPSRVVSFGLTLLLLAASTLAVIATQEALSRPEVFIAESILLAATALLSSGAVVAALFWATRDCRWLLVLPPLACAASGKALAFIGLFVFLSASFLLGSWLCRRLPPLASFAASSLSLPLFLLVGLSANAFITWAAMHFPVNTLGAYWAFFIVEVALFGFLGRLTIPLPARTWSAGQVIILLHSLLFLPYALVPVHNFDDLVAHLFIPHQTLIFGQFPFSPDFVSGLNTSMLPMGAFTGAYMLGGEHAVRLLNLSLFGIGFLALESFTRRRWGGSVAALAVLFAALTPFTHWTLAICFSDALFFATATALLLLSLEFFADRSPSQLPGIAIMTALGYLSKQQIIFIAIPLAIPLGYATLQSVRGSLPQTVRAVSVASLLFLFTISPPLIHNYILSGNPLFPFYNAFFKSPFWPAENLVDSRWDEPLNWSTLWRLTFYGSQFVENGDYSFGFAPLVLAPLCLGFLLVRPIRAGIAPLGLLALSLCYILLCFKTTGLYMRYFLGIVAPVSIALALAVWRVAGTSRWHARGIAALLSVICIGNFSALFSGRNTADPYPLYEAFTGSFRNSSVAYHQGLKKLFTRAHRRFGEESIGLIVDSPANYLAETRVISNYWHFPRVSRALAGTSDPQRLANFLFDEEKVSYLVMPLSMKPEGLGDPRFRQRLKLVAKTADFGLFVPIQASSESQTPSL